MRILNQVLSSKLYKVSKAILSSTTESSTAIHQMGENTAQRMWLPLQPKGIGDGCFLGHSHFLNKSGFWVRKDVALISAQSTAWAIEVDSQVCIISFHRHTYILFKETKSIKHNKQVSFRDEDQQLQRCYNLVYTQPLKGYTQPLKLINYIFSLSFYMTKYVFLKESLSSQCTLCHIYDYKLRNALSSKGNKQITFLVVYKIIQLYQSATWKGRKMTAGGQGRGSQQCGAGVGAEADRTSLQGGHNHFTKQSGWNLSHCQYLDRGNVKRRRNAKHRHYYSLVFLINIDLHFPNMWFFRHQRRVFIGHVRFTSSGLGIKKYF